jgi:hypothetical protein
LLSGGSGSPGGNSGWGSSELVLSLPRVCQWFLPDFGDSPDKLLERIEPYLQDSIRRALQLFRLPNGRLDVNSIVIKYDSYSFECRSFSVVVAD